MNGLQTILNPTLQSPDVRDFETALRQRVVGQDRPIRRLARRLSQIRPDRSQRKVVQQRAVMEQMGPLTLLRIAGDLAAGNA